MTDSRSSHSALPPKDTKRILARGVIQIILFFSFVSLAFFLSAGHTNWPEVWVLLALWVGYYLHMLVWGLRKSPDLVHERAKGFQMEGKKYERIIIPIYTLTFAGLMIVSGLDVGRYHWSEVPLIAKLMAFIPVLLGYIFPLWAVSNNPFAAGVMRVQEERGHHVASSGPYRIVRHPMYLGTLLFGLFCPILVSSWWALIPGVCMIVVFIIRTGLEDRVLHDELEGYKEFAKKTRYRLIPRVW